MEALEIKKSMFSVEPHVQSKGWVDYGMITKDTIIGTVGRKKRIECLCFEGDFEYRVHIQNSGWTDWTRADGVATLGTVGPGTQNRGYSIQIIGWDKTGSSEECVLV